MARYRGSDKPAHEQAPATGILITNLGTPDAPTPAALRRYLAEFLSDPRVIETSKLIWWPILYGIILNLRPRKSAAAYAKVWTDDGSPLLAISRRQVAGLRERVTQRLDGPVVVELAMRYGNPSIRAALEAMHAANVRRLLVFPLYPQYSATTTASTFDAVADVLKGWRWLPELRMINHYHDHPAYIGALAESIRVHQAIHGKADRLLFSFHGLPRKYFTAGDPYFCECHKTARLVATALQLDDSEWTLAFQSRFGPTEWLKPYTGDVLEGWARQGIHRVQLICPGFSADCLETLEEIQIQYREQYVAAGGREFGYIPALNDSPAHLDVLGDIIVEHCQGWETNPADQQPGRIRERVEQMLRKSPGSTRPDK